MKSKTVNLIIAIVIFINSAIPAFANDITAENNILTTNFKVSSESYYNSEGNQITTEAFHFDINDYIFDPSDSNINLSSVSENFLSSYSQFRDLLDKYQKKVYDFLKTNFEYATDETKTLYFGNDKPDKRDLRSADINMAELAFLLDNPENYWSDFFNNKSTYENNQVSSIEITLASKYFDKSDYYSENSKKSTFMNAVQDIITSMNRQNFTDDIDKFTYLHDTLMANAEYDKTYNKNYPDGHKKNHPNSHSPYGALVLKKAVCEGYSRALQLLCHKAGIPCLSIIGMKNNYQHQWNLVKIGDEWAFVDPTDNYLTGHSYNYNFFLRNIPDEYKMAMKIDIPEITIPDDPKKNNNKHGCLIQYGDVDRDGILTMNDASMALQKIFGSSPYKGADKVIIDVNGNGLYTAEDSSLIQNAVLNSSTLNIYSNLKNGNYN